MLWENPQEKEVCGYCQEDFKASQLTRNTCHKHVVHMSCYKKWNNQAREKETDITCLICRAPLKYFNIGFTPDQVQQTISLLTSASDQIAHIPDEEAKTKFTHISSVINNRILSEDCRTMILNSFIGYLELNKILPLVPEIIKQREDLDDQVNTLLEQHADDQACITLLKTTNPSDAFSLCTTEFEHKNALIKLLQEENSELRQKTLKYKQKKRNFRNKLNSAISGLKAISKDLRIERAFTALIITSAVGYAAHLGARLVKPHSLSLDLALTVPAIALTSHFLVNGIHNEAKNELAAIALIEN